MSRHHQNAKTGTPVAIASAQAPTAAAAPAITPTPAQPEPIDEEIVAAAMPNSIADTHRSILDEAWATRDSCHGNLLGNSWPGCISRLSHASG